MTDAEISHKLALAISWGAHECRAHRAGHGDTQCVEVFYQPLMAPLGYGIWRPFRYIDPAVIWPIAARYKCFPYYSQFDRPGRQWAAVLGNKVYEAATPELAVAMAVIGVSK